MRFLFLSSLQYGSATVHRQWLIDRAPTIVTTVPHRTSKSKYIKHMTVIFEPYNPYRPYVNDKLTHVDV